MGGYYDRLLAAKLPEGASLPGYSEASATPQMVSALNEAKKAAGPEIINATLIIPICLSVAFLILFLYMRGRKKPSLKPITA